MAGYLSTRLLLWLGIVSWLPFGYALALVLTDDVTGQTEMMVIFYGAAVLIFLAGVRFGTGLMSGANVPHSVRLAPLMGLVGLLALWAPSQIALALLVVGFGGQGALDVWAGFVGRLPQPYVRARVVMTWLSALTLLAIIVLGGRV